MKYFMKFHFLYEEILMWVLFVKKNGRELCQFRPTFQYEIYFFVFMEKYLNLCFFNPRFFIILNSFFA